MKIILVTLIGNFEENQPLQQYWKKYTVIK